jgi:pilus assembly protein CpaE
MTTADILGTGQAPILACTISRDVQNFDLLIEDMEAELGERWGDLAFKDTLPFLSQPEARHLEFIAIALNADDEDEIDLVSEIIRAAKDKRIRVILIADDVGPMALHQLMRLGADDFCPYPLPEGALHEAIRRIRAARAAAEAGGFVEGAGGEAVISAAKLGDKNGVVLPVHALAGGVGATTFAVNLAWELATAGDNTVDEKAKPVKVCLLDLNFQFGSVATYLDMPRREPVFELITDTANMDAEAFTNALQIYREKLSVLTAPADMVPLDIIGQKEVGALIAMARSLFDFVVIDMPPTVVPWSETVISACQVYFAMIELDMRSAQNTLRFSRALKGEDLPHEKVRYVLNRAPKFTDLTGKSRVKRMAESLDIKIELQLPDGGIQVSEANDHGTPLAENFGKNPLRKDIAKVAESLYALTQAEAVAAA